MRGLIGLKGVLALMGRAPVLDFPTYFGGMKSAFKSSLAAVGGSVLLIMIIARSVISLQRRAAQAGADNVDAVASLPLPLPLFQIGVTALFYLLAFTVIAFYFPWSLTKGRPFGGGRPCVIGWYFMRSFRRPSF